MGQANTLAIGLISNLLKSRYAPALHSSPEPEPQRQMASTAAPPEATLYPKSLKQFLRSPPPPQSRAEAHYGGSLSHFFPRGCVKVLNPLPAPERRTWAPWPCSPGVTRGGGGEAAWARSLAGNGRTTGKTLTNILVEGIGGKERHVRCVPRCPQGLPLDTAAVNARQRKEAAQVQTQPRGRAVQGPLGPSSLPPQQQRRRRQQRRSGAGPRAGRVGNPGDLSAACSSSNKNPAFPPRPTRGASSTASSDDLPQVRGISGYVLGFSIARASREDEVLQAHRGRLSTSGVN